MYHWRSDALANYQQGNIVVEAKSLDRARQIARQAFKRHLIEAKPWLFLPNGKVDPDEQEQYDYCIAQFEKDISAEPELLVVLLREGGE